eukprot:6645213-Pyramimonas_sp.AAC.1
MDAGRAAAGYDPLASYPRYANNVQVGRCARRDRIARLSDEVWWTLDGEQEQGEQLQCCLFY